ncbi:DUF3040 domain-containing protein [Streptomyces sp. NPDC059398]|uniref:DUF3040 domain-containing protein n=1 Tax=Streptomyces sp. NPDC059398 TaxID=3346820 RepID=UPI0036A46E26
MGLSEQERRELDALEARLTAQDPELVKRMFALQSQLHARVTVPVFLSVGPIIAGIIGVVFVIMGAIVSNAMLISTGAAAVFCGTFLVFSNHFFRGGR